MLRVLAGQFTDGMIGEIGSGCGVGTAWIASGLAGSTSLVTVELDAARAASVRNLFEKVPRVTVLQGDWRQILEYGPFAMLFADVREAKQDKPESLLSALRPGGAILLDDLTPEDRWPAEWIGKPDPVREFWLNDPRLAATEILVSPSNAVILATRLDATRNF